MSPQMKRFLPHMARRYGFEYELVTYKWPTWLHKQARPGASAWPRINPDLMLNLQPVWPQVCGTRSLVSALRKVLCTAAGA